MSKYITSRSLKIFLFSVSSVYVISMYVWPFIMSGFDWLYLQNVWVRWQPLNTGVLAFLAALMALWAAKHAETEAHKRRISASRAMLQFTLSDLTSYCKKCLDELTKARAIVEKDDVRGASGNLKSIEIPSGALETLDRCLRHFKDENAVAVAEFIHKLQIQRARFQSLIEEMKQPEPGKLFHKGNVDLPIASTIELHELVDSFFPYARSEKEKIEYTPSLDKRLELVHRYFPDRLHEKELYQSLEGKLS